MIDGKLVWLLAEDRNEEKVKLETIFYFRALQGLSGSNLIDPALQDRALIGPGIFPCICHEGCTFNLSSIVNNGLAPRG